ncbi:hypothetical protein QAD02_013211 [Eretmocerus hayati]|uniref:Uncharacterized protein n=1 Tax=Eretmocerus hayati TaxID=131215 RepID=A0ACC2P1I9_9HYME|nr:hypothetical protein QAD02_013211 [Eretmocerus hayati]
MFEAKQVIISCTVCNELFHATQKCAELTASEESSGKVTFGEHLNSVKNSLEEQFNTLKCNLDSLNKSFSKDISGLKSDLKNIKESCAYIDTLNEKIDTAQKDIQNLKISVDSIPIIEQEIAVIKADLSKPNMSQASAILNSSNMDDIVYEAQERIVRSRNLLFFNVPETNNQDTDRGIICDMLKNIPVDTRYLTVMRIGNPSRDKLRPIVATCSNNQDPHLVMRNKKKIPGKAAIGFDKTKNQQAKYKEVAAALKIRLDSGEHDLAIRYLKGTPTIVTTTASSQAQQNPSASAKFP